MTHPSQRRLLSPHVCASVGSGGILGSCSPVPSIQFQNVISIDRRIVRYADNGIKAVATLEAFITSRARHPGPTFATSRHLFIPGFIGVVFTNPKFVLTAFTHGLLQGFECGEVGHCVTIFVSSLRTDHLLVRHCRLRPRAHDPRSIASQPPLSYSANGCRPRKTSRSGPHMKDLRR